MNALDALYRCQRAWEATQPQLFFELYPDDDGLDDTHADSRSCGHGEPVRVVEPAAITANSPGGGLNPGDTEPCHAIVHAELTAFSPRVAPPFPSSGRGSVSPLTYDRPRPQDVAVQRGRGQEVTV